MKRKVVKIIDYNFQKESQLTQAFDDSNSMRFISSNLDRYVIGRLDNQFTIQTINDYQVIFVPVKWSKEDFAKYILDIIRPDVVHMHGNHGWPQYPYYAKHFRPRVNKLIFSPAGSSCGTPEFLANFDHIIVNHPLQVDRMKCRPEDKHKIIVRRRAVDLNLFYPSYSITPLYTLVYVAGFVPVKQIPTMIDTALGSGKHLAVVGDFSRTYVHYSHVRDLIKLNKLQDQITLVPFMDQSKLINFLGNCAIFVWPNIKPENPSTTTNRSVVEALGCGVPLLLGERAFQDTEFVVNGYNGYTYSNQIDFNHKVTEILNNLADFRRNSLTLAKERFSWEMNFKSFYDKLYLKS
jgi:glycosyltransferase involved in cell wall biosynthesis